MPFEKEGAFKSLQRLFQQYRPRADISELATRCGNDAVHAQVKGKADLAFADAGEVARGIQASPFKGRSIDVRQAAKELGARYVLEGGVRKSGNRLSITAQLIDAETGAHIWAERYDRSIEDIFTVQDEISLILRPRCR